MFRRYLSFLKVARDEFSDIVVDVELHADRVRLILIDSSWIDVRYPVKDKFSFHWQMDDKIYGMGERAYQKELNLCKKKKIS